MSERGLSFTTTYQHLPTCKSPHFRDKDMFGWESSEAIFTKLPLVSFHEESVDVCLVLIVEWMTNEVSLLRSETPHSHFPSCESCMSRFSLNHRRPVSHTPSAFWLGHSHTPINRTVEDDVICLVSPFVLYFAVSCVAPFCCIKVVTCSCHEKSPWKGSISFMLVLGVYLDSTDKQMSLGVCWCFACHRGWKWKCAADMSTCCGCLLELYI